MKKIETSKPEMKTRRKLLAGISLLSIISLVQPIGKFRNKKKMIACAPPEEKKTIKVLSQDGKLVEVDMSKAKSLGKISDQQLREWIKK